jgi:peptidoglycan-associated lipoprotein
MKRHILFIILIVLLVAAGCSAHKAKVSAGAPAEVNKAAEASQKAAPAAPAPAAPKAEAVQKEPEDISTLQNEVKDIHFDFDKYELGTGAKSSLASLSSILKPRSGLKVVIEGNCDERGTAEYNLALGDKRARAARQYLVASGILPSRIEVVSYGKEKPLCIQKTEECWHKNRRDHFVLAAIK